MPAYELANQFVTEFEEKLSKLDSQIEETATRIEELKQERNYMMAVELPQAVEVRVLQNDSSLETKVKKAYDKVVAELEQLEEALQVYENVKYKFIQDSADKVRELYPVVRDERTAVTNTAMNRAMAKKREYVMSILAEMEGLKPYANLDLALQNIEYLAGRRRDVYNYGSVDIATTPTSRGFYLPLSEKEVRQLVAGNYSASDLNYLDKYKHEKAL